MRTRRVNIEEPSGGAVKKGVRGRSRTRLTPLSSFLEECPPDMLIL